MKILVLPGDGIGPEITQATLTVLNRANEKYQLGLEWQLEDIAMCVRKVAKEFPDIQLEEQAVDATLADPARRTPDLGGKLGTRAFAAEVTGRI